MSSTGLGTGEAFFQSEPLTIRLKNLIRDYPEGVGIIKELVQNADDAGAHHVEITFDWRNHPFEKLPDPRMEVLMGPAMLVYNDSQFTDQDFKNIQSLGDSGKRQTLWKTGRFGVGFNSVYHVTDYPSFISRDRIVFFDPHASAIPGATLGEPGKSWKFAETGWWDFSDFMKIYEPGGLRKSTQDFEGTLFRLPLRDIEQAKVSKIRNEPFTQENVDQLLAEFVKTSEEMLIFLKSVINIKVRKISTDGTLHELLTITTQNEQEVKAEREKFIAPLSDGTKSLFSICQNRPQDLPSISYRHEIKLTTQEGQTVSTWRVTSLMRVEQELFNLMQQLASQGEKAVPWAGAAALVSRTGDLSQKPFIGRAYCFLPLPQETNLPVHLNGFFDLDSSRRELTSDGNLTGRDTKRVLWNRLLVKHVVAYAYANLIVSLVEDIGEIDPSRYYSFFPTQQPIKALEELPSSVLCLLKNQKVIRSVIARPAGLVQEGGKRRIRYNHWVNPLTIRTLPKEWHQLLEPLRLEEIDLPEPALPKELIEAFERAGISLILFKPSKLRLQLQTLESIGVPLDQAPRACLRKKEWIISLLRYCLSDGHRDLTGLPLAILEDGTLQSFGYNPSGFIYWVDSEEREILVNQIFGSYPKWFLESDFTEQLGNLEYYSGITYCSSEEVAVRLYDLVNPGKFNVIEWQPDGDQIPNISWLSYVYSYFSKVQNLPLEKLNKVPLVPCNDGSLYIGGSTITPLWPESRISSDILDTLRYFEVSLVEAANPLRKSISNFLLQHPSKFIWCLTVPDLIDTLGAKRELPDYDFPLYGGLISFLSSDLEWIRVHGKLDQDRKNILRRLSIYPANDGQPTALSGTSEKIYVPGGYTPPKVAGSLKLLRLGLTETGQEWREFYSFLEVKVLDHSTMIQHLLQDYASLSSQEQIEALEWIRDHLDIAQSEQENRTQKVDLKRQLQRAALICCRDGKLRAAVSIYDPRNIETVREILGDQAQTPDMSIYKGTEHWLDFFRKLGIKKTPRPSDILAYIDIQIQNSQNGVTETAYKGLKKIFLHIEEHWETFKEAKINTDETFAEVLKAKAWLPAERDPNWLSRYPGFIVPQNRLYRSSEICFANYGYRVASQKPLLRIGKLPERDFQQALGFRYLTREDVTNHFIVLIDLWESNLSVDDESFQKSLKSIYTYLNAEFLSNRATEQDRQWLRNKLTGYKVLWGYGQLWKPEHTFQRDYTFFGKRRQKIAPDSPIREVFELLGQRQKPGIEDYLLFLDELANESRGESLSSQDTQCAYEVIKQLARELELTGDSANAYDLMLLTDDSLLMPPEGAFIPDAPWHLEAVKNRTKIKILHPEVPHGLAIAAGCRSFLESVVEQPTSIQPANEPRAKAKCQKWQAMLRSPEFIHGLERLIANQKGNDPKLDMNWLTVSQVVPAAEIQTKLLLDGQEIASGLRGSYYFDVATNKFYISCDDDALMLRYLVESLNNRLNQRTRFKLNDTGPLSMIIDTQQPGNIVSLLDRLNVKALNRSTFIPVPFEEIEEEPDKLFTVGLEDEDEVDELDATQPEPATAQNGSDTETQVPENASLSTTSTTSPASQDKPSEGAKPGLSPEIANILSRFKPNTSNGSGSESTTSEAGSEEESPDPNPSDGGPKPIIKPVRPTTSTAQGSSTKPRGRGILDVTSGSESSDSEDGDTNGFQASTTRPTRRIRLGGNQVVRLKSSDGSSSGRSRSSGNSRPKRNSGSSKSYSNSQFRPGVRVRSGLESDSDKEPKTQPSEQTAIQIDKAGMARVMEYERRHDRQPQDMNDISPNHPGYDVESTDPQSGAVRYIEVKSLRGKWDRCGVCMTLTQFETGNQYQDDFWLYVVELAETDEARVITIQNPVGWVGEFYYDESWRQLAEDEGD